MNPSVIMYLGILVAMFILVWGISLLYQRYSRIQWRKKADVSAMHTWMPLPLDLPQPDDEDIVLTKDPDEDITLDLRSKSQQNGHFSESKPTL